VGVWHDIKARLGLGDDEYDEYDEYDEDDEAPGGHEVPRSPYDEAPQSIRRVNREPDLDRAREAARHGAVVEPRTFSEAQAIADKFKQGVPVIMNLTMTDQDLAKRLLDFASGLTYGLNGGLQKVSDKVFMLTPANVDVSDAQRAAMRDRGLFGLDR
jgi:cell division inhibitor SepF